MSKPSTVTYRCEQCLAAHQHVQDKGKQRKLWCGRCGCNRWFMRTKSLKAPAWPPQERAAHG